MKSKRLLSAMLASLGAFSSLMAAGKNDNNVKNKRGGGKDFINKNVPTRGKSQFARKSTQLAKTGSDFDLNIKNAKKTRSSSSGKMNRNFKNKNVKNGSSDIDSTAVKNMNLSNIDLSKGASSNWWNNLSTVGKAGTVGGGILGVGGVGTGIYFLTRFLMQKFGKCNFIKYMKIINDDIDMLSGSNVMTIYDYTDEENYKFSNIKFYLVTNGHKEVQNRKFYLISKIENLSFEDGDINKLPDKLQITQNNISNQFLSYDLKKNSLNNFDNTKEKRLFVKSAYRLANCLVQKLVIGKKMMDSSKLYESSEGYDILKDYARTLILDNTAVKNSNDVRFYVLSDEKIESIRKEGTFYVEEINVNDDNVLN